jgi:hypothetical protein
MKRRRTRVMEESAVMREVLKGMHGMAKVLLYCNTF